MPRVTKLPNHVIFCFGAKNWLPRNCALTYLDYFLWDFLKSKVHANHFETVQEDHLTHMLVHV